MMEPVTTTLRRPILQLGSSLDLTAGNRDSGLLCTGCGNRMARTGLVVAHSTEQSALLRADSADNRKRYVQNK